MTRVIAEIGVNHMGDGKIAESLVRDASSGGAWGVKFQLYVPELLDSRRENQQKLREWILPVRDLRRMRSLADRLGLAFGASAFDNPSVELLSSLSPDFQKVACGQAWPGMKRLRCMQIQSYTRSMELDEGVVPLLCVPRYPAHVHDYLPIPAWARGISDHTGCESGAVLARGLEYVEVHIHDNLYCPDADVSIFSGNLRNYVAMANRAPDVCEPARRTRFVLKRPIKGQRVAWLRGVE